MSKDPEFRGVFASIHTALAILGRPAGAPRRPMRMLGKEDRATLERLLRGCEDLIRWN